MSVVWLAVFAALCVELVFTAILVAPLPIVIRNGIARFIYRYKLGDKLSFFLRFATLALMFAVWDSVQVRVACPISVLDWVPDSSLWFWPPADGFFLSLPVQWLPAHLSRAVTWHTPAVVLVVGVLTSVCGCLCSSCLLGDRSCTPTVSSRTGLATPGEEIRGKRR